MGATRAIAVRLLEGLREVERRLIRPLGQRLRPPRARRQRAGGPAPEMEELLVALLRTRLRDGRSDSGPDLPALPSSSDLDPLVRALVEVPPRRDVCAVEPLRKVA